MLRLNFLLTTPLIIVLSFSFTQGQEKVDQAEDSSSEINFPVRRSLDVGGVIGGGLLFMSTYRTPRTEELLQAEKRVAEARAALHQEYPDLAAAQADLARVQAIETIQETKVEITNLEQLARAMSNTAAKYDTLAGKSRVAPETLEQLRQAEASLLADLTNSKRNLLSQSDKNAMLKEARDKVKAAEREKMFAKRKLSDAVNSAEFDLKKTVRRVRSEESWAPATRRVIGGGLFLLGLGDMAQALYFAWTGNTTTAHLATPHELGRAAPFILKELTDPAYSPADDSE